MDIQTSTDLVIAELTSQRNAANAEREKALAALVGMQHHMVTAKELEAEIKRLRGIVDELGGLFRSIADTLPVDGTPTVQHARRLALDAIAEARAARKAGG